MGKDRLLAVTMGDPAGIGPEVTVKALAAWPPEERPNVLVVGDPACLASEAKAVELRFEPETVSDVASFGRGRGRIGVLPIAPVPREYWASGKVEARAGRAAFEAIVLATSVLTAGQVDGLVTAPVSKEAIVLSGTHFLGHTEYLAQESRARRAVMLFVTPSIRVALVTTHVALRKVPLLLSTDAVLETIVILEGALRARFGLPGPRICVCGLNPHAGESGLFGSEDERIVAPAVAAAKARGIAVEGPLPADAVLPQAAGGGWDAAVALYHDQGLIAAKMAGGKRAVNVTLGLPFVRTSVAHGTAFDIAGRGMADPTSMREALRLAYRMTAEDGTLF